MRLKEQHIEKIATLITRRLREKDLVTFRKSEYDVLHKIISIINADMQLEVDLESEARKLMAQFRPQIESGEVDERALFMKIKKQLAKQKKIIL